MDSLLLRGLPPDLALVNLSRLRKHEVFAAQQRWRRLYASTLHEEAGRWTYRGYDWHTFSYGYTPCLEGPPAVAAMFQRQGESVLIIADAGNPEAVGGRAILQVAGDVLRARNDWILVAQDFSWTFVLTHESAMGPYFAEACEDTGQSQFRGVFGLSCGPQSVHLPIGNASHTHHRRNDWPLSEFQTHLS